MKDAILFFLSKFLQTYRHFQKYHFCFFLTRTKKKLRCLSVCSSTFCFHNKYLVTKTIMLMDLNTNGCTALYQYKFNEVIFMNNRLQIEYLF